MFEPFPVLCQLLHFMDTVYLCKSSGEDTGPEKRCITEVNNRFLGPLQLHHLLSHSLFFVVNLTFFTFIGMVTCVCFHSCFEFYLSKALYNILTLYFFLSFSFFGGSLFFFFCCCCCLFVN